MQRSVSKASSDGDNAQLPNEMQKLRACMVCSLVKTMDQFDEEGCDNCESILQVAGQKGAVFTYTSANYEGIMAIIQPKESWVAKWQRLVTLKPGMYAVNVRGYVDPWIKDELAEAGLSYICRDKMKQDFNVLGNEKAKAEAQAMQKRAVRASRSSRRSKVKTKLEDFKKSPSSAKKD